MNRSSRLRLVAVAVLAAIVLYGVASRIRAASKNVDLDAIPTDAAEGVVSLDILTTYPPKIQNRVTNRFNGNSYTFRYPSAGPGGFSSQLASPPPSSTGVGTQWVWQTGQTIYSFTGSTCANDICFTLASGPGPSASNTPAHRVPGRTLVTNNVTPSASSLTASLLTFFSPPQLLVEVTSSVAPLASGQLAYKTTYTNNTAHSIFVDIAPGPVGCCPSSGQLHCDDGECVDYLFDAENCGACGHSCEEELDCGGGYKGGYGGEAYCYCGTCYCDEGSGFGLETGDASIISGGTRGGFRFSRREEPMTPMGGKGCDSKGAEAPVCETSGSSVELEYGDPPFTVCYESANLPKELASVLAVCGNDIPDGETACGNSDPASSGTFMQFVPDDSLPYPFPGIFLTPYQVTVTDSSGDGVFQPGESGTVYISVLNAGTDPLYDPAATLASPPVDLTDDGVDNPASITIFPFDSAYSPDLLGVPPAVPGGTCLGGPLLPLQPSTNVVAFGITIPPDHPEDVARPFTLTFRSETAFGPIAVGIPVTLGIGSTEANLRVELSDSPDPVLAGSDVTYTMLVTNGGPVAAANVRVKNTLPTGASWVSTTAPAGWTCSLANVSGSEVVTCERAAFPSGASCILRVRAHVPVCAGSGALVDTATVSSDTPDESPGDNSDSETTQRSAPNPSVQILQPSTDQTGSPSVNLPIRIRLASQPGGNSPIVRETVSLEGCLLWDGFTTGDRDGLLSDEFLQATKITFCQAMARCGLTILQNPRIRVAATDSCGRVAHDDVIIRKRMLKTEVCAR